MAGQASEVAHDVGTLSLPIADCVYSQRGRDAIQNAKQHVGHQYMLTMDIRDCYPSVTVALVKRSLERAGFNRPVAALITKLVTYHGRLPQGAITSAAILNCVLADVGEELLSFACGHSVTYTRFVDDLCFSGSQPVRTIRRLVRRVLGRCGFEVSFQKTRSVGPQDLKIVTGLAVSG